MNPIVDVFQKTLDGGRIGIAAQALGIAQVWFIVQDGFIELIQFHIAPSLPAFCVIQLWIGITFCLENYENCLLIDSHSISK